MSSTVLTGLAPWATDGLPSACTEVSLNDEAGFWVTRPPFGWPPSTLNLGARVAPFDSVIVPRLNWPIVELMAPRVSKLMVLGVPLTVAVTLLPSASASEPIDTDHTSVVVLLNLSVSVYFSPVES